MQADLMKPLPLPFSSYDAITCVGVTTYIEPYVIVEWCKVVKPGLHLDLVNMYILAYHSVSSGA